MDTSAPRDELASWKEIAAYLGVSIRTAQLWESQRALPVHRLPGPRRGQVRASTAELEAWRAGSGPAAELPPAGHAGADPAPNPSPSRLWPIAATAAAAIALIGYLLLRSAPPQLTIGELAPLTSEITVEIHPALSPDNASLAYVRIDGDQPARLILRHLSSGKQQDLGEVLPGTFPRWSEGGALAWFGPHPDGVQLRLLPATGAVREGIVLRGRERQTEALNALLLDWLDDHRLVLSDRAPNGVLRLVAVDVKTGDRQPVTQPPPVTAGDVQPAVRNRRVAFARYQTHSEAHIWVRDLKTGEERRLTSTPGRIDGITWLGQDTVLAAMLGQGYGVALYALPLDATIRRLTGSDSILQFPHVAGQTLVVQHADRDANIWSSEGDPHPVAPSTLYEGSPAYSRDGAQIAFTSRRSGFTEIWVARGSEPARQVTHLAQTLTDSPRWSPDGRFLAFTSHREGNRDIYLANVDTSQVRQFTSETSEEGRPSWSGDGQWIYFRSNRGGSPQIWRKRVSGGEAQQITREGGFEPIEAPDGERLFYIRDRNRPELWSVPVTGGPERFEHKGPVESRWAVASDGVYYEQLTIPATILRWRPGLAKPEKVYTLPPGKPPLGGFSVTEDGRRFLWSQVDRSYGDILQASIQSSR